MRQVSQGPQLSFQQRHRFEMQFAPLLMQIFDGLLQPRAHLRELLTTFRYIQQLLKMLRRLKRRLIARYEYPYRQAKRKVKQKQLLQNKKGFEIVELNMRLRPLAPQRRFLAFCRFLLRLPILEPVNHRQSRVLLMKYQERCMRNLSYLRILELNPISISF